MKSSTLYTCLIVMLLVSAATFGEIVYDGTGTSSAAIAISSKGDPIYGYFYRNLSDARPDVPLFGDGMWVDTWPMSTDPPPSNSFDGDNGDQASMHRFCIARHRRAINISYVDNHVAVVELEELWQQHWHRGYEPRYDIVVPD